MVGWHQLNGHEFEQTPGDREAWHATVHGFTKSWTRLSNQTTTIAIKGEIDSNTIIVEDFNTPLIPTDR